MLPQLRTTLRAVLAITLVGVTVASLAWLCFRDPQITFLPGDGRAEWIVFPSAPDGSRHLIAELDAIFRRDFVLDKPPRVARLIVRAAKRAQLKINGRPVDLGAGRNWKEYSQADVLADLHVGTNTIEVDVFNANAPPALWLALETDQLILRSDGTWEVSCAGSAWRRAALATVPRMPGRGNLMAGGEGTLGSLAVVWPMWVIWGGLSIAIWTAGRWWLNRIRIPAALARGSQLPRPQQQMRLGQRTRMPNAMATDQWLRWKTILPLLIAATLWVALFCNNSRTIQRTSGFDSTSHVDYIAYIQKHWALPLANEGWEMYQAPLYYGISAVTLSSFGFSVTDEAAAVVLRLLTMGFGLVQMTLVFLSMRLLFPGRTGQQWVGLVLGAFLPMQLYMSHYVTNETLAATLVTASILLCLRRLREEKTSLAGYAGLGICLGAALLTKVTGVLLVPFVVLAVAAKLARRRSALAAWWRVLGVMLVACFIVCGWYYCWIWHHFGTLLMGNWNALSGFSWWQDYGYHTMADFTRFGRSLVHPLFSGFSGFADGIYSTLWGDGLCSGLGSLLLRPPWNYNLMCAGYLLAVVPTVLVLAGVTASVWRLVRQPSAEWFVLLGFSGLVAVAMVFMSLKVPSYAQVKAFYGLCALMPFCSFGAVGWEVLTRGRKLLRFALGVILLVWAMNCFASFWIRGNSAPTHIYLGAWYEIDGKTDAFASESAKAVDSDPSSALARRSLAMALIKSGKMDEALPQAERAVELNPTDSTSHGALSAVLFGQGQIERAIDEGRRAMELGPENQAVRKLWLGVLAGLGRNDEAIGVARDGLAAFPYNPNLHYMLGLALARKGDFVAATNQFVYALLNKPDWAEVHLAFGRALLNLGDVPAGLRHFQEAARLAPDSPPALNELAWLLATGADAALRNGPEAVRLAEHACAVTNRRNPTLLDTLAAAYAEAGRFPQAVSTAQEASSLARTTGNEATVVQTDNLLGLFQSGRPFHQKPAPAP